MGKVNNTTMGDDDAIDLEKTSPAGNKSGRPKESSENEEADLEKAIELTGFGWYHICFVLICGCCIGTMVLEVMGISFILPAAQCDLELTTAEKGYMSGVTFFGMVVSAHMWGFCADTYGRKKILLTAIAGCWTFSFFSSFAPSSGIFIALRFLTGFFLCGNTSTVYAYLSEFLHTGNRSKVMTWTCGGVAAAYLFIPGLAWILIPKEIHWDFGFVVFSSWRIYIVVLGSFSLLTLFGFIWLPESPKFLSSVGKKEEALNILRRIYALNTGNPADEYPVKILKFDAGDRIHSLNSTIDSSSVTMKTPGLCKVIWQQTAPLFCKPYGWKTLLFCCLQFGIYLSSSGLYLWMPNILNMMTLSGNQSSVGKAPETICEFIAQDKLTNSNSSYVQSKCSSEIRPAVYMSSMVIGIFYSISYSSYGLFISKFGNKIVPIAALLLGGITGIGSYFARNEIIMTLLLALCVVLTGTCINVLSSAIVDAYPTNLRAMAVFLTLTCGRLGSGVAGNAVGILIESYCDFTIIGLGCVALGCSLLCTFIPRK